MPVPFPWAWGYRALRKLGVPIVSDVDPEDLRFGLGVPDWAWPGRGDDESRNGEKPPGS